MATTVFADTVSLIFYPNFNINGDEEELDDWTSGDDYTYLTLDESRAFSLKYSYELGQSIKTNNIENNTSAFIYVDYTTFNLDSNEDQIETGKYQSITGGLSILGDLYSSKYFGTYYSMGLGVGGSRFDLSENEYMGTAELFFDSGVSLFKQLYLSVGCKLQIIGKPTETMADAYGLNMGLSVKY